MISEAIKSKPTVFVIGALNVDVYGVPAGAYRPRDSNPGRVTLVAGGVGHNIARHLAREGIPVELITVLGDDDLAALLTLRLEREGVGLTHAVRLSGGSSAYVCLHDTDGDMIAAVNDMGLLDAFTPARIEPLLPVINAAPLVVLDANPPKETLECIAERATAPLLLDPVSGFKAERVRGVLGRFAAIKPNLLEAQRLSGEKGPARAAAWFLSQGVAKVFVSLGSQGVYYAGADGQGFYSAARMRVKNCTGAGDAMVSGIAAAMLKGLSTKETAIAGVSAVTGHLLDQGGILL